MEHSIVALPIYYFGKNSFLIFCISLNQGLWRRDSHTFQKYPVPILLSEYKGFKVEDVVLLFQYIVQVKLKKQTEIFLKIRNPFMDYYNLDL